MASSVKGDMDIEWFDSEAIQRMGGEVDFTGTSAKGRMQIKFSMRSV